MASEEHPGTRSFDDVPAVDPVDWLIIELSPLYHELAGKTRAQNEAHIAARIALIQMMLTDGTLSPYFNKWGIATGLEPLATRSVALLDEIAALWSLPGRWVIFEDDEMSDLPDSITVESKAEADRVRSLLDEALEAYRCFMLRFWSIEAHTVVTQKALHLVKDEWGLPWPWLCGELVQAFFYALHADVQGSLMHVEYWFQDPHQPSQQPFLESIELGQIDPLPGECVGDAFARAIGMVHAAFESLLTYDEASVLPPGRPTPHEQIVRDVQWWYLSRIRHRSKQSLAREYSPHGDTRHTISDGIERATHWFDTTPWTFADADQTI